MFDLAWDVQDLEQINESGRKLLVVENAVLTDKLKDLFYNKVANNFPVKLRLFKEKSCKFLDSVVKYRQTPATATHTLVFMISPEERLRKPYALPIQFLAYQSLTDDQVRQLSQNVINEMRKRGMEVAGMKLMLMINCY